MTCVRCRGLMVCEGERYDRFLRCLNCGHIINEAWKPTESEREAAQVMERAKAESHRRNTKLREIDVQVIRRLAQKGFLSFAEIARRFHVTVSTVSNIVHGRTWTDVETEPEEEPEAVAV